VSDRFPKASPWPLFVALGFVLLEVGLLIGFFPIAVGGVLLFGGSVAGILTESGYTAHLWRTLIRAGAVFCAIGIGLIALQGTFDVSGLLAAVETPNAAGSRLASRGVAVALGGLILIALGTLRPPARSKSS
jgi:hypothetical protein